MRKNAIMLKFRYLVKKHDMSFKAISLKTGINSFLIFNIAFNPLYRIKLSQGMALSHLFRCKVKDLFDILIDIQPCSHI
jgi:hypothetical protein